MAESRGQDNRGATVKGSATMVGDETSHPSATRDPHVQGSGTMVGHETTPPRASRDPQVQGRRATPTPLNTSLKSKQTIRSGTMVRDETPQSSSSRDVQGRRATPTLAKTPVTKSLKSKQTIQKVFKTEAGRPDTPTQAKTPFTKSLKSKQTIREHVKIGSVQGSSGVTAGVIHGDVHQYGVSSNYCIKDVEKDSERYQKLCKERAEKHVRTTLYHQVLTKLEQTKSVLLLADAGDGKSTLLQLVGLQYGKDGFLTLRINTPSDITNYNIDGKHVLFVCDNLLGETEINEDKTKAWKNSENEQFPDDAKFLFACRLEFWSKNKADLKRKQIFNETVDVRSDKLTYEDKKKTLDQHFGNKISEDIKKLIAENSNFAFPECCRFVSHSQGNIDFSDRRKLLETFSNPFTFVLKQLETIERNNKIQYSTLVFCLLNDKILPKTGTCDVFKQFNFEVVRKLYLSYETCSIEQLYDTLLDNVKELEGWLLTQNGDNYTFYHDSIFSAMSRLHGDRYPDQILTFCKPGVVFSIFSTNQVSGSDPDRVTLPPRCYPQLLEIVIAECEQGWKGLDGETWRFVFQQMNRVEILKDWSVILKREISFIKETSPPPLSHKDTEPTLFDVLMLMTNIPDCGLTTERIFQRAAFLESGMSRSGRVFGLMFAIDRGLIDVVKATTQRIDPSIQERCNLEELCEAMSSDREESVVEIMKSHPNMNTDMKWVVLGWAACRRHIELVRMMVERRDLDIEGIVAGLVTAVRFDSVECFMEIIRLCPDVDMNIIHGAFKDAVSRVKVGIVTEMLKRLEIDKQTIKDMLDFPDSELFVYDTDLSKREETRTVLVKHMNTANSSYISHL